MAKKTTRHSSGKSASQFADVDSRQHVASVRESRFYARLKACSDQPGVNSLITTVDEVWKLVDAVTKRVSQDFRDYTLHDMRHLGNVLWLMEQLVPPALWDKPWKSGEPVGPLQCAVTILAVLVHDLGMALPDETRKKLKSVENPAKTLADTTERLERDVIAYRRHFMAQEHDVRTIQALERDKPNGYLDRIEHIRQQIRTEYLRQTHADDAIGGEHRIQTWLEDFAKHDQVSFRYAEQSFLKSLAQVALSHGQSLDWLARTFDGRGHVDWRNGESIDWLWTGWLLRLGDILDFDASRAPRVLFRQFRPSDSTSVKHWYQHLCIGQRVFRWDDKHPQNSTIEFRKSDSGCPNPDILKGVSDYCGWIRQELAGVEKARQQRAITPPLRLPGHSETHVKHDLQIDGGWGSQAVKFELSQDQVVKILMGEELYGEPSLCLRELVQNSLDALHLRWLRSELRRRVYEKHGIKPGLGVPEPVELSGLEPVDLVEDKSKLGIKVSWGEADLMDDRWPSPDGASRREPRHFIDIEDNGVGMTFEVVKRYFTQIGKSYYQSPEYSRERALMREFQLPVSEISQFGIGILSCFMLADLVEIWTCPAGVNQEQRQPHHLKIWGPDGLFWHEEILNSANGCGTLIRLWLRAGTEVGCDPYNLISDLQNYHFSEEHSHRNQYAAQITDGRTVVDPLRAIWSVVSWPRYPIHFTSSFSVDSDELEDLDEEIFDALLLDDTAVLRVLANVPCYDIEDRLCGLVGSEDCQLLDTMSSTSWRIWDWEDLLTASRVRIAAPIHGTQIEKANSISELFGISNEEFACETLRRGLVETVLSDDGRTRWTVRGMLVDEPDEFQQLKTFSSRVGTCCVVDLSGHAAPGLKSDRSSPRRTQRDDWLPEVQQFVQRWKNAACDIEVPPSTFHSIQHGLMGMELLPVQQATNTTWHAPVGLPLETVASRLVMQEFGARLTLVRGLHFNEDFDLDFDDAYRFGFEQHYARELDLDQDIEQPFDHHLDRALKCAFMRALALAFSFIGEKDSVALRTQIATNGPKPNYYRTLERLLERALKGSIEASLANCPDLNSDLLDRNSVVDAAVRLLEMHFLNEGCYPNLAQASGVLGLPVLDGSFIDGQLTAPLAMKYATVSRNDAPLVTIPFEESWASPEWLRCYGYDLVAPFTLHPLGLLRSQLPKWGQDRLLRAVGLLPFLPTIEIKNGLFRKLLPKIGFSQQFVDSGSILLLMPGDELLRKQFLAWDQCSDDKLVVSALWDVPSGDVLWAEGFQDRNSIKKAGLPLDEWLKEEKVDAEGL